MPAVVQEGVVFCCRLVKMQPQPAQYDQSKHRREPLRGSLRCWDQQDLMSMRLFLSSSHLLGVPLPQMEAKTTEQVTLIARLTDGTAHRNTSPHILPCPTHTACSSAPHVLVTGLDLPSTSTQRRALHSLRNTLCLSGPSRCAVFSHLHTILRLQRSE